MVRAAVAVGVVVVGAALVGVAGGGGVTGRSPAASTGAAVQHAAAGPDASTTSAPVPPPVPPDAPATALPSPARTYVLPLEDPVVVARPFDDPPQPWRAGHRGVDLAARPGQPVLAPAAGVVTFSGTVVDRGVLTIVHPDGLRSSLEPVDAAVPAGRRVLAGQAVASVAAVPGHCAPAACLHWGVRRGEAYLDPLGLVLHRGPVVLLPQR